MHGKLRLYPLRRTITRAHPATCRRAVELNSPLLPIHHRTNREWNPTRSSPTIIPIPTTNNLTSRKLWRRRSARRRRPHEQGAPGPSIRSIRCGGTHPRRLQRLDQALPARSYPGVALQVKHLPCPPSLSMCSALLLIRAGTLRQQSRRRVFRRGQRWRRRLWP